MSNIYKKIYFVIVLFGFLNANAQEPLKFKSIGAIVGYGKQLNRVKEYNPIFFSADLAWQIKKQKRKIFFGYYITPQFNIVPTEGSVEIEYGSNFGFRFYQRLSENLYLYQMLGTGPHFISAHIERQAKGFIFSDNAAVGVLKMLTNKVALHFQVAVRHISNAGLKRPNRGVNTLNIKFGLSKVRSNGNRVDP